MKRRTLIAAIIYVWVLLLVVAGVLSGAIWLRSARHGEAAIRLLNSSEELAWPLGSPGLLSFECMLPWGQELDNINWQSGEGFVQSAPIRQKNNGYSWNGRSKIIEIPLKSFRTGKLKSGELSLTVGRRFFAGGPRQKVLSVPGAELDIEPLPIADRDNLLLAGELQESQKSEIYSPVNWLISAVVLLLIGVMVVIACRRNQVKVDLPPWEVAMHSLSELRKAASTGSHPLEWCVGRLTDVVRDYLSERFHWPVRQQTTAEFFASLKHVDSPLTIQQTRYLEDFMHSADLVKFANIRADIGDFMQAVDRAGELIEETGHDPEAESNKASYEVKL